MGGFSASNLTLNYSAQLDPAQTSAPGTFVFETASTRRARRCTTWRRRSRRTRSFKIAWTKKLCAWANSGPDCDERSRASAGRPGLREQQLHWRALVHELFTSPLVTYATPTATARPGGNAGRRSRAARSCARRWTTASGLTDVCGLAAIQTGAGGRTIPAVRRAVAQRRLQPRARRPRSTSTIPIRSSAARSRRSARCAADKVVDVAAGRRWWSGRAPALRQRATRHRDCRASSHGLMGLDSSRDAQPIRS